MFFPEESLKRGGRFYLCWVADSWPLRFAAITQKQLWSVDVRVLCQDLLEVVTNESGRPTNRFSLRLSSQLIRGLVRLYEKKVTILLSDLCMINAHVFKSTNKKYVSREVHERPPRALPRLLAAASVQPEQEQRVEDLIQNSGNIVSNIQDITLKEATIPDFQLPPNDNFGEENPDQPLLSVLGERTIEMMMKDATTSGVHVSGLEVTAELDKSHDKSRGPHEEPQMESVSQLDMTLFRKSTAADLPEFEIDIPERGSVLPVPPEPAPEPETQIPEQQAEAVQTASPAVRRESVNEQLDELEAGPPAKKRRLRAKLIIDKKTQLTSDFLRARVDNPKVELRCEDFTDAIIEIRTPYDVLFRRPAASGRRLRSSLSRRLLRLFQRNLGVTHTHQAQDHETELLRGRRTRSHLEQIVEVQEPQQTDQQLEPPQDVEMTRPTVEDSRLPQDFNITDVEIPKEPVNLEVLEQDLQQGDTSKDTGLMIEEVPNVDLQENVPQVDISDLPTQKLQTLSQEGRKRAFEDERETVKRQRSGYMSFRESQRENAAIPIVITEPDKENIPPNTQAGATSRRQTRSVSGMLQEAGLADRAATLRDTHLDTCPDTRTLLDTQLDTRKEVSDSSESQLGSLDRTKVSLGDSVHTTDSQKFIRNQWGIEGTMTKIMRAVKAGRTVTVDRLLAEGPVLPGHRKIIAARCFTSILKLKQHGFVRIAKDPETLEIVDMSLGPRFDTL